MVKSFIRRAAVQHVQPATYKRNVYSLQVFLKVYTLIFQSNDLRLVVVINVQILRT